MRRDDGDDDDAARMSGRRVVLLDERSRRWQMQNVGKKGRSGGRVLRHDDDGKLSLSEER